MLIKGNQNFRYRRCLLFYISTMKCRTTSVRRTALGHLLSTSQKESSITSFLPVTQLGIAYKMSWGSHRAVVPSMHSSGLWKMFGRTCRLQFRSQALNSLQENSNEIKQVFNKVDKLI